MGGLFSSPPPPPKIQKPAPMPDEHSPETMAAKRQQTAEAMARGGGRQSTILTSKSDRPDSYTGTALGGGG